MARPFPPPPLLMARPLVEEIFSLQLPQLGRHVDVFVCLFWGRGGGREKGVLGQRAISALLTLFACMLNAFATQSVYLGQPKRYGGLCMLLLIYYLNGNKY